MLANTTPLERACRLVRESRVSPWLQHTTTGQACIGQDTGMSLLHVAENNRRFLRLESSDHD